jgi:UDP-N-acetylglucosamine 2-epimerase (non-hydrolysing)
MRTILTFIGTRPEAIKLAPVLRQLEARREAVRSIVCVTGQHRELLRQTLEFFSIKADVDLDLMRHEQSLTSLTVALLGAAQAVLDRHQPDWVVVQGDTTTAMAASLAAFYNDIKIAHVEAGLRTGNKRAPFPEEINRRITGIVADRHFAPTEAARMALLAEGCNPDTVLMTGNPVIDALYWARDLVRHRQAELPAGIADALTGRRLVLVTAHRRENFDAGMEEICAAIRELAIRHEDILVVFPVHPNPNVREPVERRLSGIPHVHLLSPLDYGPFVALLDRAHLLLTDSGGVQEEAAALGKPMLVLREVTERPQAIANGNAILTGADRKRILAAAEAILTQDQLHREMSRPSHDFGDGRAGERIAENLANA